MSHHQQKPERRPGGSPVTTSLVPALGILGALCLVGSTWLTVISGGPAEGVGELAVLVLALYAYLVVGLVLLRKTPSNPLAWALTTVGVFTSVGSLAGEYAEYSFGTEGVTPLPGATFAAWINAWWWFPTIAIVFLFVPLLFPNGQSLSPRWRWLTWLSVALLAVMVLTAPLNPVLSGDTYEVANPIGVAAIGDIEESALGDAIFFTLLACVLLAFVTLILRFRRSRGVERQQMKWFVFGAGAAVAMMMSEEVLKAIGLGRFVPESNIAFGLAVATLPVTIGVAVLKYRLYEIDRVISRTLSYAVLTAVLIGLYLAAVTGLTAVSATVANESPVAVAAATLLAAAAFGPARSRIQAVVDRRFNRAQYDAAKTVDEFRSGLRDELDLSAIAGNVKTAVGRTVEPSQVLVWLRTEGPQ